MSRRGHAIRAQPRSSHGRAETDLDVGPPYTDLHYGLFRSFIEDAFPGTIYRLKVTFRCDSNCIYARKYA